MPKLLVTIHGVTSDNQSLRAFADECVIRIPNLKADTPSYGNVFPLRLAIGSYERQAIVRTTQLRLQTIPPRYPGYDVTVACHSFGTYALGGALELHVPGLIFDNIALFGSILPENFEWEGYVLGGIIRGQVVNFARPLDHIVSLSRLVDGGFSGNKGFSGSHVCNLFKDGGHGGFFPDDIDDVCDLINGTFACQGGTHHTYSRAWARKRKWTTKLRLGGLGLTRLIVRNPLK